MLYEKNKKIKNARELLSYLNMYTLPINVEKICSHFKILLQYDDLTNLETQYGMQISGLIYLDNEQGEKIIAVNKVDNTLRQRFTIAHELGHYFLHFNDIDEDGSFVSFRASRSARETEANNFAAELLMPEDILREEYNLSYIPSVSYLASKFKVSTEAMGYRLKNLGLWYV